MTEEKNSGVAIFDLDGTITSTDTFIEFIRFTNGSFKLYLGFLLNLHFLILYILKVFSNEKFKSIIFAYFFKNCDEDALNTKGTQFSNNLLPQMCYSKANEKLEWHKSMGHKIVILTASSKIWLNEWCTKNNYILIGTEFEIVNKKYTGKILGNNCYGKEKIYRLQKVINLNEYQDTYGYGDSKSDLYYLKLCKHYINEGFR